MKSLAIDLLEEELAELVCQYQIGLTTSQSERAQLLRDAIQELKNTQDLVQLKNMSIRTHEKEIDKLLGELHDIKIKTDCLTCRYNRTQEELSEMNDEDYLQAFDKCRTCKNYYPNNFEEK